MILKNDNKAGRWKKEEGRSNLPKRMLIPCILLLAAVSIQSTCKYGFKDTSPLPPDVKTFRVSYFENKAQYVNPQLAPQLTEKLKQKIINTTRLKQTNTDEADYDISG